MIRAYIDGGARGNPGPAGYGVRIETADGELIDELHGALGIATNNVAEYNGLLAALQWAIDEKLAEAFRLAPRMSSWWVRRASLSETRQWFIRSLDAVPGERAPQDRARALGAAGNIAMRQGECEAAEPRDSCWPPDWRGVPPLAPKLR